MVFDKDFKPEGDWDDFQSFGEPRKKKQDRNKFFKRGGKNRCKQVFLFLLLGLFMVSFASAAEWDNVKSTTDLPDEITNPDIIELSEEYPPIQIENSLGLGKTLFEGYLSNHTEECGLDCQTDLKIELGEESELIQEIAFYTLQDDDSWLEQDVRSYEIYYWGEVPVYEEDCDGSWENDIFEYENGTLIYTDTLVYAKNCSIINTTYEYDWIQYYVGKTLEEGTYSIKIEADKKPSRTVDWQIKTQGKWIDEWAVWGNITDGDDAEVILNYPDDDEVFYDTSIDFNCSAEITGGGHLENISLWNNISGTFESTDNEELEPDGYTESSSSGASSYTQDIDINGTHSFYIYKSSSSVRLYICTTTTFGGCSYVNVAGYDDEMYNVAYGDGYLWLYGTESNNRLFQFTSSGSYVATFTLDLGSTSYRIFDGMTYLDGYLYAPRYDSTIVYRIDPDDGDVTIPFYTSGYSDTDGITNDGTNFWIGTGSGFYQKTAREFTPSGSTTGESFSTDATYGIGAIAYNSVNDSFVLFVNDDGDRDFVYYTQDYQTETSQEWTKTISDDTLWTCQACDSDGDCGFAESNFTVLLDSEAPEINLTRPSDQYTYGIVGLELDVNWTVTDPILDSCWYDYNGTNVAVNCSDNHSTITIQDVTNKNLTFYANDTFGNQASATTNWTYLLTSTGQEYNPTTSETQTEEFSINISYNSVDWSGAAMTFTYDETEYSAPLIGAGDDIQSFYSIDIPAVSEVTVNEFFWTLTLTNVTGDFDFSTDPLTQTVQQINFTLCTYADDPQLLFKTFDVLDPTTAVDATFKSSWTIRETDGGAIELNRSYQDLTETNNEWAFCITPDSSNYTVSVDIVVDATQHTPTTHYIVDTDYTSNTENISLYLLNNSDATLTEVELKDNNNKPIEDAYITVQRYDVGTDTYYNYGVLKTDSSGTDLIYLLWYDDWYKFVAHKNGVVLAEDGPKKVSSSPVSLKTGVTNTYNYEQFKDIAYSLVFNEDTDNFVLTYVDPTGLASSSCLDVVKQEVTGDTTICNSCATTSSATMYCNIADQGNGTFLAKFYVTGSPPYYIDTLYEYVNAQNRLYDMIGNDDGTGLAILVAGIVMALFLVSPAMGVLGMIAGMALSIVLGFQPLDIMSFAGITIVGFLIMWAVKR